MHSSPCSEHSFLYSEHSFLSLSSDFTEVIELLTCTSVIANEFMGPKPHFYGSNQVFGVYFRNPTKFGRTWRLQFTEVIKFLTCTSVIRPSSAGPDAYIYRSNQVFGVYFRKLGQIYGTEKPLLPK